MPVRFQPSRHPAGEVASVQGYTPASDQTIVKGDIVTYDNAADDLNEHGLATDVEDVLGVALEGAESGTADSPSGEVAVAKATRDTVFMGQVVNSSAVVTDLSSISIGDQYGVVVLDGIHYVDEEDTSNVLVQIVDIDDDIDVVWFKFLESTLQEP